MLTIIIMLETENTDYNYNNQTIGQNLSRIQNQNCQFPRNKGNFNQNSNQNREPNTMHKQNTPNNREINYITSTRQSSENVQNPKSQKYGYQTF